MPKSQPIASSSEELDKIIQQHRFDVEKLPPAGAFSKAKTAILELIKSKELEARIDELKRVPIDINNERVHWTYFRDRQAALKPQPEEEKK